MLKYYNAMVVFEDGSFLKFGHGNFDDWCVFLTRKTDNINVEDFKPRDWQYFKKLQHYASIYGDDLLYKDFVAIYDATSKNISSDVFDKIKCLSKKYVGNELNISIIFSILYMGMIAEENKKGTHLGKRIKRLGMHQILKENVNYKEAANFSRNKRWQYLDKICKNKGF